MRFEWDEAKRRSNLQKHGFDFTGAAEVFGGLFLRWLDDRHEYGEDRWIGIGRMGNRIVTVVYTEPDESTTRIISLRKALKHERERYEQAFRDRLGAG